MFLLHFKRILIFAVVGFLGATAWVLFAPKVYEARLSMTVGQLSRRPPDPEIPEAVGKILDRADSQQTATEVDVLKQPALFIEALTNVAKANNDANLPDSWQKLYAMYTVIGGPTPGDSTPVDALSNLAQLYVRAYSAQTAIDLAHELARVYSSTRQRNMRTSYFQAEAMLEAQIATFKKTMDRYDAEYAAAKERTGILDLANDTKSRSDTETALQNQRNAYQASVDGTSRELAELKRDYARQSEYTAGPTTVNRNPVLEGIDAALTKARTDRAALLAIYQPSAQEVRMKDDEIRQYEAERVEAARDQSQVEGTTAREPNQTKQTIQTQIAVDAAKLANLQASLADSNTQYAAAVAKSDATPGAERDITEIERNRRITEVKYENLKLALDEIENRLNAAQLPATIIDEPTMRMVQDPVEPNVARTYIIGILGAIALGAVYSVSRESVKPIVFSATQLEQTTGLPVVATLPKLPGGEVQRIKTLMASPRFPRKNFHDLASVALADREALPRTVVVCGVDGDANSASAAVSYAAALARAGLRVTLVDANPAKTISRVFGMENETGIIDYLTQAALISQSALGRFSMLTKQNDQLGCKLCAYGTADSAALTDFSDDRLAGIIEALRPDADVLVIETASAGRSADAVRMARHADEVLATFESGTSNDRSVDTLRDVFAEAGVKKMSMVLTNTLERVV